MIKYIIFLQLSLFTTYGFPQSSVLFKYQPAKLLYSIKTKYHHSKDYNINNCTYTISQIKDNILNVNIDEVHESKSCIGPSVNGWMIPAFHKQNFNISSDGVLVKYINKESYKKLFRLLKISVPKEPPYDFYIPLVFPSNTIYYRDNFTTTIHTKIDESIVETNLFIEPNNTYSSKTYNISFEGKKNNVSTIKFNGIFNNDKGFWEEWSFHIFENKSWISFIEFKLINAIK